jgi:hypothetical protein
MMEAVISAGQRPHAYNQTPPSSRLMATHAGRLWRVDELTDRLLVRPVRIKFYRRRMSVGGA